MSRARELARSSALTVVAAVGISFVVQRLRRYRKDKKKNDDFSGDFGGGWGSSDGGHSDGGGDGD